MMTDHDTRTLNSLIATTLDSVDGYREAADKADHATLAEIFRARANEREEIVRTMQAKVRAAGGNPEDDGTILAGAHRVFLSLRDAVTGERDDDAVVAEVERGEDHIKSKYEDALKDDDLSVDTKTLIADSYTSVKRGHDQMSQLKHAMSAA